MPTGGKTVSDKMIVEAISEHEDPVVSAKEIAEKFSHTRQWAHNRLTSLSKEGRVQRKNGGPRSVMWYVDD